MSESLSNRLVKEMRKGGLIRRFLMKIAPVEGLFIGRFSQLPVDRPIFIIGAPRSGTSILYEILQKHGELAYLTQASDLFPEIPITANLFCKFTGLTRIHPTGIENREWGEYGFDFAEGFMTWSHFGRRQPVRTASDVTEEQRQFYQQIIQKHLYLFGRSRFISKSPFNSLRIGYLNEIFPDALFIHIYRDGGAVARSALEMRIRYGGPRASFGPIPPELVEDETIDPLIACALQWKYILQHVQRDLRAVVPERQISLAYESFTAQPAQTIRDLLTFCGLQTDAKVTEAANDVKNRAFKWQNVFTDDQITSLESSIGEMMLEMGYNPDTSPSKAG